MDGMGDPDLESLEGFRDWVLPSAFDIWGRPLGYSLIAVLRRRAAPLLTMVFRLLPF
jgi:hypothetical protein